MIHLIDTRRTGAAAPGLFIVHAPTAPLCGRFVDPADPDALQAARAAGLDLELRSSDGGAALAVRGGCARARLRVDREDVLAAVVREGAVVRCGEVVGLVCRAPAAADPLGAHGIVGRSRAVMELARRLHALASRRVVLLLGETGAGKELCARALHGRSGRRGDWVPAACPNLGGELFDATLFGHRRGAFTGAAEEAPGLLAAAAGGTLFLDEIADIPLARQAQLLRLVELGEYRRVGEATLRRTDAALVLATNVDLPAAVATGRFRTDLWARLVAEAPPLVVPPLRARREDLPALLAHFAPELRLDAAAWELALAHDWPLNVRQVRAVTAALRLSTLGESETDAPAAADARIGGRPPARPLGLAALRDALEPPASIFAAVGADPAAAGRRRGERPTRDELERALKDTRGRVSAVAARFGAGKQVYRWLRDHGLEPGRYRPSSRHAPAPAAVAARVQGPPGAPS
jgi:DNA-binding NtrC family response regulator